MGKKEQQDQKVNERVEAVLKLLRKQAPLTVKQVGFGCIYSTLAFIPLYYFLFAHNKYHMLLVFPYLKWGCNLYVREFSG